MIVSEIIELSEFEKFRLQIPKLPKLVAVQSSFQLFEVLFTSIFDTSDPFTRIFSMIIMLFSS